MSAKVKHPVMVGMYEILSPLVTLIFIRLAFRMLQPLTFINELLIKFSSLQSKSTNLIISLVVVLLYGINTLYLKSAKLFATWKFLIIIAILFFAFWRFFAYQLNSG